MVVQRPDRLNQIQVSKGDTVLLILFVCFLLSPCDATTRHAKTKYTSIFTHTHTEFVIILSMTN